MGQGGTTRPHHEYKIKDLGQASWDLVNLTKSLLNASYFEGFYAFLRVGEVRVRSDMQGY